MKNIAESSEVFEAHATIGAAYYMINKLYEKLKPRTQIESMIDNAVGYNQVQETAISISELLDVIIERSEFIEADYSNAIKLKEELKKFITTTV